MMNAITSKANKASITITSIPQPEVATPSRDAYQRRNHGKTVTASPFRDATSRSKTFLPPHLINTKKMQNFAKIVLGIFSYLSNK